jgi:hypothetical protein
MEEKIRQGRVTGQIRACDLPQSVQRGSHCNGVFENKLKVKKGKVEEEHYS